MKTQDLNSASEKEQFAAVKADGTAIQSIENPSIKVQEYVILNYPDLVLNEPKLLNKISSELKRKYSHVLSGEDFNI